MYQHVLVPLDRSAESEGILDAVPRLVNSDGKATLLTVIPPGRTRSMGELVILGSQQEEEDRSRALAYLNRVANRLKSASVDASTAVVVNDSVPAAHRGLCQSQLRRPDLQVHPRPPRPGPLGPRAAWPARWSGEP